MTLAMRIPGVTGCAEQTPDAFALDDVTCYLPGGSLLEISTFATQPDELRWIGDGGTGPGPPDPSYAGCCIEGDGWAATVGVPDYVVKGGAVVTAAIGGRVVNG
jgi:hypothetical protein